MENPDGVGEEGNFKCGDAMKIFIKVENNKISEIKFLTYGCIAAIASTDMLCEMAKGKTLEEAENISAKEIADELGKLPTVKFHCSIMGQKALKRAIEDYKSKNDN